MKATARRQRIRNMLKAVRKYNRNIKKVMQLSGWEIFAYRMTNWQNSQWLRAGAVQKDAEKFSKLSRR